MSYSSLKEDLLRPRSAEETVDIPGVGTLTIRCLTRSEAHQVASQKTEAFKERKILHYGIAEPQLTDQEIAQWMQVAPAGEIQKVVLAISHLSGMAEEGPAQRDKDIYRQFPDES